MRKIMSLTLVFCLAFGLTVAACTTANAGIDKSNVEAGRVHIKGKIDTSHDLVVRIDRDDKPMEWRSSRTGGGEFEVVVEASDKIRLEDGKTGHGVVVTTKMLTSSAVNYVHCAGDLAGTFANRREADFVTKDGVLTFADVTLKEGKKLPVSLPLNLSQDHGDRQRAFAPQGTHELADVESVEQPDHERRHEVFEGSPQLAVAQPQQPVLELGGRLWSAQRVVHGGGAFPSQGTPALGVAGPQR